MNAPVVIKGWCPTALHPMMSGDGLLLRVPVRKATIEPPDLIAIAELSQRYGNGLIDLTQRANLQLRGVSHGHVATIVATLRDRNLIEGDAEDAPVNIICDPLSGLDTDARDMRPLSLAIERGLRANPAFAALPSKFGFALDGAGRNPMADTGADNRLIAQARGRIAIGITGAQIAATVDADCACEAALTLAFAFLCLRRDERRMHALVARIGADAVFARAGLTADVQLEETVSSSLLLGVSACGPVSLLGLAAPFGAWRADDLHALAKRVAAVGRATVRVTPSRILLVVGLQETEAHQLRDEAAARGLIVSADDRRARVAACVGAPGCSAGQVSTRALASEIARFLPAGEGIAMHVSGCAKGCAHPTAAPLTVVGRAGAFDLVENGSASDVAAYSMISRANAVQAVRERFRA